MMRTGAPRALLRPLTKTPTPSLRLVHNAALRQTTAVLAKNTVVPRSVKPLALAAYRSNTALIRSYAAVPGTTRNPQKEQVFLQGKLQPDPDAVTTMSSIHPVLGEVGEGQEEQDTDMMAGVRHDIVSFLSSPPNHSSTVSVSPIKAPEARARLTDYDS